MKDTAICICFPDNKSMPFISTSRWLYQLQGSVDKEKRSREAAQPCLLPRSGKNEFDKLPFTIIFAAGFSYCDLNVTMIDTLKTNFACNSYKKVHLTESSTFSASTLAVSCSAGFSCLISSCFMFVC